MSKAATKNKGLIVLVTQAEAQEIQAAADSDNRSVSSWLRLVILDRLDKLSAIPAKKP